MANPIVHVAGVADTQPDCGYATPDSDEHHRIVQELFARYYGPLRQNLTRTLQSEAEAKDVAQEAYLRILQLKRPGTISHLRAYLFRTASNIAIDRLRRRRVREEAVRDHTEWLREMLATPGPERIVLGSQHMAIIKRAMLELPEKCRLACALHFLAELTPSETADALGLSRRMVRYYLARGLAHCRRSLDGATDEACSCTGSGCDEAD